MKSTVSSKGQVTLPAAARKALGLCSGSAVVFELRDGEFVLRKGGKGDHPVDRMFGVLEGQERTHRLIDEMRGPRAKRRAHSRG